MPGTADGPPRALRAGVDHLERRLAAQQAELRAVRSDPGPVTEPLVRAIEDRQQELGRWRAALEIVDPPHDEPPPDDGR